MNRPPLTSMCAPWTKLAPSEASITTIAATSSGLPDPPERGLRDRSLEHLPRPRGDHRRVDDPRVHAVRGDPVRSGEPRDRLRQRGDAGLGRRVARTRRQPAGLPGERPDGDDPPLPARDHHLERRLRDEKDAAQVDGLDAVPLVRLDPVERRRVEGAGAGDEDVQAPRGPDRLLDDPPRVLRLRHVGGHVVRRQLLGRPRRLLLVQVGEQRRSRPRRRARGRKRARSRSRRR